ncbi:MAG: sodium:proton antiporter [Hyphomicrobiales bacterium]|jgi:CPA1 family monovalent cation:H+ antiporter|nr:sodium:proton antiporter [Hyphomicrobiales bacterium]
MFSFFDMAAIVVTFAALLSWINNKYLPLSPTAGLLALSAGASGLLILAHFLMPSSRFFSRFDELMRGIDFADVVMDGILAFLLFAAAINTDLPAMRRRRLAIALLAIFGTLISALIVGGAVWATARLIGRDMPLAWALVFGAVISPTDPVAVLSTLKNVQMPQRLRIELQGESLFNDGIGIVLFTLFLRIALGAEGDQPVLSGMELLVVEAGGGILLGLCTGYLAYRAVRSIDDYKIEIMISLALAMSTYALAKAVHVSGPLSVVAAGLLLGHRGPEDAMSERTQRYVFGVWDVLDEVLNAVLFLLLGLQLTQVAFEQGAIILAVCTIPIVLFARLVSVAAPILFMPASSKMAMRNVPFLTWAGVRGGISVALALSIPAAPAQPAILAATYAVVLFSILVQGSTLKPLARKLTD